MKNFFLYLLIVLPFTLSAQSKKERKALEARHMADEAVIVSLSNSVTELSAILQQAQPSLAAQTLFCNYLSHQFGTIGLLPAENNSFIQSFVDEKGQKVDASTFFVISGDTLIQGRQYFPLIFSANANVTGMPAPDLKEQGQPWFIDVKDWLKNETDTQQSSTVYVKILEEVSRASQKGATALILYNSSNQKDSIAFDPFGTSHKVSIPVVYLQNETFKKYYADRSDMQEIALSVAISPYTTQANNIIGYINNASQLTTIVTSSIALPTISDGVKTGSEVFDISATSLLIELAKMTMASTHKNTNYLFVTFVNNGANNCGVGYLLNNTGLKSNIKYMLNLTRLAGGKTPPGVYVQGVGTSPQWKDVFANIAATDIKVSLDLGIDTIGCQAAFYAKEIPALIIGTAAPVTLLGLDGKQLTNELALVKYVSKLLETADGIGKLLYTTTTQPNFAFAAQTEPSAPAAALTNGQTIIAATPVAATPVTAVTITQPTLIPEAISTPETVPAPVKRPAPVNANVQYSVSLGVIPVGNYSGQGFKIGGVTPKRLAEKIGLKAGDVLLQLGEHKISEMSSYLQALANFKKGDVTILKVMRENDEKLFTVKFQ